MKRMLLILITIAGLIPFSIAFGQGMTIPKWINGTWHNSYESNTEYFVFWTFAHDSIFIDKGLLLKKSDRKCLNKDYSGYKITEHSTDSVYQVHFSKDDETSFYEFKLQKVYYSDKPALTYSLTINGIKKTEHSTDLNRVFTKSL
jgi:hypothetical protein